MLKLWFIFIIPDYVLVVNWEDLFLLSLESKVCQNLEDILSKGHWES